jgi:hypothetical protein
MARQTRLRMGLQTLMVTLQVLALAFQALDVAGPLPAGEEPIRLPAHFRLDSWPNLRYT